MGVDSDKENEPPGSGSVEVNAECSAAEGGQGASASTEVRDALNL